MPTTPRQQFVAARRFARRMNPSATPRAPISFSSGERLRIGFVSSDFRSHATVSLMLEFWQRLDRNRLETFAYGILPRDSGPVGRASPYTSLRWSPSQTESQPWASASLAS